MGPGLAVRVGLGPWQKEGPWDTVERVTSGPAGAPTEVDTPGGTAGERS